MIVKVYVDNTNIIKVFKTKEEVKKFNPNHDKKGRFTNASGSYSILDKIKNLQNQSDKLYNNSFSDNEIISLYHYTSTGYIDINNELRSEKPLSKEAEEHIKNIDSAMEKTSIPDDIILYRSASKKIIDNYAEGETFIEKAFMSTSVNKGVSNKITEDFKQKRIQMEIEAPKGTRGIFVGKYSAIKNEQELILDRNMKLKVINKNDTGLKVRIVNGKDKS